MGAGFIEFQGVHKTFLSGGRSTPAIDRFDLTVDRGEFLAVVGPSGCGKSTILNMVAGLVPPTRGRIRYGAHDVVGVNTDVGYMTQHDGLLPWRTVADNVAVPLEIRRVAAHERAAIVGRHLDAVGLAGFGRYYPKQLSGGMRKRAMLARTLIYDPATLLMDEPFGALDAQLKIVLQEELLRLWSAARKTMIFVTHDIVEAITLADRVVVLSSRPSGVKLIETIALPRPRDVHEVRFTKEFGEHYRRLWDALRDGGLDRMTP